MGEHNQTRLALNDFFVKVQHKALRQAEFAVGDKEEALDIVQQAMMKLAAKYSGQADDWPQLFQRILQNAIRDWYRRQKIKRLLFWQHGNESHEENDVEANNHRGTTDPPCDKNSPEHFAVNVQRRIKIEIALKKLPPRQQQVFLLRAWWGHSTEEAAFAMQCSTGTIKTHYSRALQKLQGLLEDAQ